MSDTCKHCGEPVYFGSVPNVIDGHSKLEAWRHKRTNTMTCRITYAEPGDISE